MAPLLKREFGKRLRIVHLLRHPVQVAASVVTHRWYQEGRTDTLNRDIVPAPSDPGVIQAEYADRWADLSLFEKGLFYWTEVHLFGLEVERRFLEIPYHRMRFEDVVSSPDSMEALARFLGLEHRPELSVGHDSRVDRFRQRTPVPIDADDVFRHPRTLALAAQFGYDPASIDNRQLRKRYGLRQERSLVHRAVTKLSSLARGRSDPG